MHECVVFIVFQFQHMLFVTAHIVIFHSMAIPVTCKTWPDWSTRGLNISHGPLYCPPVWLNTVVQKSSEKHLTKQRNTDVNQLWLIHSEWFIKVLKFPLNQQLNQITSDQWKWTHRFCCGRWWSDSKVDNKNALTPGVNTKTRWDHLLSR